jgi:hypothetical protein
MPRNRAASELGERLRDQVEAEAAEAEADDDEDEDEQTSKPAAARATDTDDDEQAPVEPQAKSDKQLADELGRVVGTFEAELCTIFGVEPPLVDVPMQGAIGYMLPGALELKANDKFRCCLVCNGHGQVLTGSLANEQQTANCPRCGGRGYLERLANHSPPTTTQNEPAAAVSDDDAFGVPSWMGDPSIAGQTP